MLGGISIWQLVIVLAIVIMIFGTKKLRSMGGDLGGAVKGFKKAMSENEEDKKQDESKKAETLNHNKEADADFAEAKTTETEKDQPKS